MAELPEIAKLAGQMKDTLVGKTVQTVVLLQEKCANTHQMIFKSERRAR